MAGRLARPGRKNHFPTTNLFGYRNRVASTYIAIRRLQRALHALGRGLGLPRLKVDGRLGRKTVAALARFLAAREREGEAALLRALRTLD